MPVLTALFASLLAIGFAPVSGAAEKTDEDTPLMVSYYKQVRPIFQSACQGCHQPAKDKGAYVMTNFKQMLAGGDSGEKAIIPGNAKKSHLIELITPKNGKAEMPQKAKPLSEVEINLIARWIDQGAKDDTPSNARQRYDMNNPPVYTAPPSITSLDYSPDGKHLAVAGFHEVLLMTADGSKRLARLVGMSQRIASVRFSPDGSKLAVTGGLPARMGEVQVWDVAKRKLLVSKAVTYDTVYGVSWSPDGTKVAVGCTDNSVRALDANTGEQLFFNAAHNDWPLGTTFSADGKHVVSIGRDMSTKLYEVGTERFIDNVTSITPGALKGGLQAITRHPTRNEILVGGSDGTPKIYRIFRTTARKIGDDANLLRNLPRMTGRIFGVAITRDGDRVAAASALDNRGEVLINAYGLDKAALDRIKKIEAKRVRDRSAAEKAELTKLKAAQPSKAIVTKVPAAVYAVAFHPDGKTVAAAGSDGRVRLIDASNGKITQTFSPAPLDPSLVEASGSGTTAGGKQTPDFILDVNPVLTKVGCNAGTCHGAAKGKAGFQLSLRGYDAIADIRALSDDLAGRRINLASPDDSLMLTKATGAVPHEGGQRFKPGSKYYRIVRDWIAGGAKLDLTVPRVASIEITPKNPVLQKSGDAQPMRVVATYTDGKTRDVTELAFVTSANSEVATANEGVMKAVRRGEAAVLARYEGAYAATLLTVMGDRSGFTWNQPESWGRIDDLVAAKWQRMKIQPSALGNDAAFLRRVYIDLTGMPPTPEAVEAFLADKRPTRQKRDAVIDKLIGSPDYVDYWTNKWADLLQVNSKFLGRPGATALRDWIKGQVADNTPYDQFVRSIITAEGSNRENPAASFYKIHREPGELMETTTHLFLAVRFNCNKCHDHPFEKWTQDQYFTTAAYFARVGLKADPKSGKARIGGTAVEGAKPLYEIVYTKPSGEITHDRTKAPALPEFPFEVEYDKPDAKDSQATPTDKPAAKKAGNRRDELATWLTAPSNPYFARSYVNRLWGYMFGTGIMEPIDDLRAGNPPTNPALLSYLEDEFIKSGFNVRHMHKLITKSRVYQLSFKTNKWNEDDKLNYSHRIPKRLPAEVIYDAVYRVTGSTSRFPGVKPGTRAAALPDVAIKAPGNLLATLGRPVRESACECERKDELHLGSVMAIVSGPAVADAIADRNNAITKLAATVKDDRQLINAVFMRVLNRPAKPAEIDATLAQLGAIDADHRVIANQLASLEARWAPVIAKQEAARQQAMAKAKADLDSYTKQIAPRHAKMEADRQARVANLTQQLKELEANLPQRFAQWDKQREKGVRWVMLDPSQMTSSNGAKLVKQKDLSVLATGPNGKTVYEVTAEAPAGVTGIRLELLPDKRLPKNGPGRSPSNGNFVLTELEVFAAPKENPTAFKPVKLQNAIADFSQKTYDVATAIDGKTPDNANGWASSPKLGVNRTAMFETQQDVGVSSVAGSGVILKFRMIQYWSDGLHTIGKFRLSVTDAPRPLTAPTSGLAMSDWQYLGPFKGGDMNALFNKAFPPEKDVNLKLKVGNLKWTPQKSWVDGKVHNVFTGENTAHYIFRTITVAAPTKLPLSLGSDDGIKVFLNGKQVLANNVGRGAAPDQEKLTLNLKAGENELLMKVVNGAGSGGFYFKADGKKAVVPADVLAALDTPADKRNKDQQAKALNYFRSLDSKLMGVTRALAAAKKPLGPDAGITQRKQALALASKPVPLDRDLVEWRRIAAVSAQQQQNKRLTLAQDLAWALINSPAFLFNH